MELIAFVFEIAFRVWEIVTSVTGTSSLGSAVAVFTILTMLIAAKWILIGAVILTCGLVVFIVEDLPEVIIEKVAGDLKNIRVNI